jgi:hypothetical protein
MPNPQTGISPRDPEPEPLSPDYPRPNPDLPDPDILPQTDPEAPEQPQI